MEATGSGDSTNITFTAPRPALSKRSSENQIQRPLRWWKSNRTDATTSGSTQSKVLKYWASGGASRASQSPQIKHHEQASHIVLAEGDTLPSKSPCMSMYQESYTHSHRRVGRRGIRFDLASQKAVRSPGDIRIHSNISCFCNRSFLVLCMPYSISVTFKCQSIAV